MNVDIIVETVQNPIVRIALILLVIFILQIIAGRVVGKVIRHAVKRGGKYKTAIDEKKREDTLITIFQTASAATVWIVGTVVVLSELNVNVAALATGAGFIGIIIGVGAQSAISDLVAGVFVIIENQYRVGDIVTLNAGGKEISGVVEDITIRVTRLRDLDGKLHTVRNGLTDTVTNMTFNYANVNVDIGVAYESDVDLVERVINKVGLAISKDETWKNKIIEPIAFLRVDGFEDSAVRIKALGKVEPAAQWDVAGEFRRRIKKAFEQEGVTIPFPQVVVHKPVK